MSTEAMSLDAVLEAVERIDSTDGARSWHLAMSLTNGDERRARELVHEAAEFADTLVADPVFQRQTHRIAAALLAAGHLDGPTIRRLHDEEDDDHGQP